MKRKFFIVVIPSLLFANYAPENIAYELKKASEKYNIDKRILYTLAKIESNFNPLIISFVSDHQQYNFSSLIKRVQRYKDRYIIIFQGNEKDLQNALRILLRDKRLRIDVGLMQINSVNFEEGEIDRIFDLAYNIAKSNHILKACISIKSNFKDSIECYNKGTGRYVKYDYFNKFKKSYLKDFSNITEYEEKK